jgi:hypothetical protein
MIKQLRDSRNTICKFTALLLLFALLVFCGCARNASGEKGVILNMQIKVEFRENVDLSKYNYYFVFSGLGTPKVPSPDIVPEAQEYFPTPGREYDLENRFVVEAGIQPLYQEYFSTWSDYIVFSGSEVLLYKSGSASFDPNTNESNNLQYEYDHDVQLDYSVNGKVITLILKPQDLSKDLGQIYFTFLTSQKRSEVDLDAGYLQDVLENSDPSIVIKANRQIDKTYDIETGIDNGGADIYAWEARIY